MRNFFKKYFIGMLVVAGLGFAAFQVVGQEYLSRFPRASEEKRIAGLKNNIQLELERRYSVTFVGTNYTVQPTNGILVVNNTGFTTLVDFPNPTNNQGRIIELISMNASVIRVTNSSGATRFSSPTNGFSALFIDISTNRSGRAFATASNWMVHLY